MKIGNTIYFDHQATTPVDAHVLAEMTPYFSESFGNPHSADHVIGWNAALSVEKAVERLARFVGADADEIIFTSGATESNNLALLGIAHHPFDKRRRRILVSDIEHKSVLAACRVLEERLDYEVDRLPVNRNGLLNLEAFKQKIDDDVLLVSVMAVNSEIGTIQPIEDVSAVARDYGALFHCDASQAPCALDTRSVAKHADLISLSSHKFYGPMGIGVLAIRREMQHQIEPLIYGGGQQNSMRPGTIPVPLCVGMASAASLLEPSAAEIERQSVRDLSNKFVTGLESVGIEFTANGPPLRIRHPGNVNICFKGLSGHELLGALQPHLAASMGSACTSGLPEPSQVLRAIGLSEAEAESSIRFSLGRFTTESDVDEAIDLVSSAIRRIKMTSNFRPVRQAAS